MEQKFQVNILCENKAELDRLVTKGKLVAIQESDWATPIIPIKKPSGQIRTCKDYKVILNPRLRDMVSTTPAIENN